MIDNLVIFAAGRGTRMGDVTSSKPKPLIEISGKPLLFYSLDMAASYNFKKIIINSHHLSHMIDEAIDHYRKANPTCPEIIIEYEENLLETGGTIKKLTKLYDLTAPIFTLNSDVIINDSRNIFEEMINYWSNGKMDLLLLLQKTENAFGYTGKGDFNLDNSGNITRAENGPYPYMFAGMQIVNPQILINNPNDVFSFREYYPDIGPKQNEALVKGTTMEGLWYHATNPHDIEIIEKNLLVNSAQK